MSQASNWGVPQASPATPAQYANRDQDSLGALLSAHRGSARPSYAVAGTVWAKTVDANTDEIYYYDGSGDILIGTVDVTNNIFKPVSNGVHCSNSNGNPNLSDTYFNIISSVAASTWESVGPTGSGADNIWTALDAVPAYASTITLKLSMVCLATGGTSGAHAYGFIAARKNGSSEIADDPNTIASAGTIVTSSGDAYYQSTVEKEIQVSSRIFDVFRAFTNFSVVTVWAYLTGWDFYNYS